jgi:hypothetical protein
MHILSFVTRSLARLRYGKDIDPARDWIALLTLSLIIFAGILVWNAWAFDTVVGGGVIGSQSVAEKPLFNSDSLTQINAVFTARSAEEGKYVTGVYQYADPSH